MGKDSGTFCGDKRMIVGWVLVKVVLLAAWLTNFGGRRK